MGNLLRRRVGEVMEAGRELDALVAEKVMGWFNGTNNPKGFPHYSRDIHAAWLITAKFSDVVLEDYYDGEQQAWTCYIGHKRISAKEKTAPLAICLAALKAVGTNPANQP